MSENEGSVFGAVTADNIDTLKADTVNVGGESPYSINFKSARGALLTIRGTSTAQLGQRLLALQEATVVVAGEPEPLSVVELVALIESQINPGGTAGGSKPAPGPAQAPITPKCETCGADAPYKEGTSKAGKPYKGYFCSADSTHVKWVR